MLQGNFIGVAILFLVLAVPGIAQEYSAPTVVGTAYDRSSGHFLYTERHFCSAEGLSCQIEYRDSLGAIIARKKLDYTLSLVSPALVMNDYRQDLEFSVPASESEEMVIDSGFDNYIRRRWDELLSGNDVVETGPT